MKNFAEDFHQIIHSRSILVYGAKIIAAETIANIRMIAPSAVIVGCAVSSLEDNDSELMGIQVKTLDDYRLNKNNTCVLIALGVQYHEVVIKNLLDKGYQQIYAIDSLTRNFLFKKMMQTKLKRLLTEV